MSKAFAEKIIASMVDEDGNCFGRGISERQFDCLIPYLEEDGEEELGYWSGQYTSREFFAENWAGNIGPYRVKLQKRYNWNVGFAIKSIELRPADEYEAELEDERMMRELRDFSGSEWVAEPKKRLDLDLTLVNDYVYEGCSYSYYDSGVRHVYTFRDGDGNCIVWKTQKAIDCYDEDTDEWTEAEVGSKVTMRATVKQHSEYRGTKQTIITRPQIKAIA